MIDRDLLTSLGWSAELIDEVNRVAEPLRALHYPIEQNVLDVQFFTSSVYGAVYADPMLNDGSQSVTLRSN